MPDFDGQFKFDNANNSALSLHHIAELARRGEARVFHDGFDGTGKMVLRITLPGSETIRQRPKPRR